MSATRPTLRVGAAAVIAVLLVALTAACGSSGSNSLPVRSTTSTAAGATTTAGPASTTTRPARTTTTDQSSTSTASTTDPPASSSTSSSETTTSTSSSTTTSEATTSTTERTTTTERSATTTSTPVVATTVAPSTVSNNDKKAPWLALGLVGALLALLILAAVRHTTSQRRWWGQVDGLLRDGQALVDLGRAGPAATDPAQQMAHWSALEQRAQALGSTTAAVRRGASDADVTAALDALGQSSDQYLASIRRARALRIGPPAPTTEQLGFADADARQRLEVMATHLNAVDQLALPHRKAPAS